MTQTASMGVLLDHAQDIVVLLDETGTFTYANAAVDRNLGWDPETLVGESAFDYVHREDFDDVAETFRRTIESDSFAERTVEHRFRAADGSWVWLESRMSNLTDEQLEGYVVSSRDITDRVVAQRERRETAARLREIAATTGDVLWMFDGDWSELLFVNPAYEAIYGGCIDELERDPQSFLDTVHPDDVSAVELAMRRLSTGEAVDVEYRVDPETDYGTWVWVQAQPLVVDDEVVHITGFARDVTDRRRRERQLRVMDNLLRHNLRNDLNVIQAHADLVGNGEADVTESVAVIRRTADALLASAEKQRDLIAYLTGDVTPGRVDVAEMAARAASTVRQRFPAAAISVATPDAAPAVALGEVEFALTELLENAVQHADDSPEVTVEVSVDADALTVTVADRASPIPEFESSVLAGDHEMSDIYHSTGLGLWLVYWVVDLSGGRVAVEERASGGNRVVVHLPAAGD
ncbi:PAS domain S-box protein [Salinirubellus salinus]|uniref:histidine kinase n=1 Tax=Salinirubellus salinus TaxID=1364945 RepID=A0A9E7U9I0_9EURY|nr:PAS domain S-box protein [Salinirubellus salinus]UWM53057.1 PAS domain S-box protein [Salinirubellus salinus]